MRVASDAKIANNGLGEIIVVARRAITVAYAFTAQEAHGNVSEISEKALKGKAISHGVKYVFSEQPLALPLTIAPDLRQAPRSTDLNRQ